MMMYGAPYYYDAINADTAPITPSTVHVSNTGLSLFFQKYLTQRAMSVYKFTMPETWCVEYVLYTLFIRGYFCIINTDKFGVIPQGCGLRGFDVMYSPTNAIITNPLLSGILEPRIHKDCTVIKLQPDYSGIYDLVSYYGDMMALCAETAGVNLLNSKLSYVFGAKSKQAAESLKKVYDRVASGEPAVVYDNSLKNPDGSAPWEPFTQDVGANYITDRVLSDLRTLENQFDTFIGIPNANTEKRERLISDEVSANAEEVKSNSALWLEQMQKGCAEARQMFGIDLSVDWRFKETGGDPNEGES